ncbi:Protein Lines, N-terminal [Dillenia turbinata]|uniref:Protein Lines, N-terminal n=1 Tax=Dillenia turbinata TaxID=194707 RepID=A0AAN8UTM0_9MAGN
MDSDSDDEDVKPKCGNHCLIKCVIKLIPFLSVGSKFIQHISGNILVVMYKFLAESAGDWHGFIQLLCICLQLAINKVYSSYSSKLLNASEHLSCSLDVVIQLQPSLETANLNVVSGLIRVMRNILKLLNQREDSLPKVIYLDHVNSCLSNVPWISLIDEALNDPKCDDSSGRKLLLLGEEDGHLESRLILLGYFLQFLCSLVDQSGLVEREIGSNFNHPILFQITSMIPRVLNCCLCEERDHTMFIIRYFKHKMLMMMIRLSSLINQDYSVLVSWVQLLHKYFEDDLEKPIMELKREEDASLIDSPFLNCTSDLEGQGFGMSHLQRQVIFLFLKCSISLMCSREKNDPPCRTSNLCPSVELKPDQEFCTQRKSLLEIYTWLERQISRNMFMDEKLFLAKHMEFSLSILQLYMHEDDLLFKMLLLQLSLPSSAEKLMCGKRTFQEMKDDILFHVSNIFNPISVFHLFLAELSYDHQVLLDYLISKDTGISCGEYLLRCLRLVCDSWGFFVEFFVDQSITSQSCCKKINAFQDGPNSQSQLSSLGGGDKTYVSLNVDDAEKPKPDISYGRSRGNYYANAKVCLLLLKNSIENLRQKNLFPYNPEALLRRLSRFQELCHKQEEYFISNN